MDDNADSQEREEGEAVTEAQLQAAPVVDVDVEAAFEQIRQALRGLRYGDVRVTVQDGVVVQIERTERRRPPRTKR
ncbi:MAG: YezD family protein [Planctomycetaceae bacterium]|nr:YezD family protein [Planctomycetaceae bacterium]